MNNVTLVGRLTADPELKHTQSDVAFLNFTVAVDRPYSKDKETTADFIRCVAWRGTAEFISKYFFKGMKIGLVGRIQTDQYTDSDGNKRTDVKVNVVDCEFVERKQNKAEPASNNSEDNNEDFPF